MTCVVLFSVGLALFLAYFVEYFIHTLYVIAGIVHKKLKLRNYSHLVLNACAKLVAYFGCVGFDSIQSQLVIGIVEKAQEHPCNGQVGRYPYLGDRYHRIWQKVHPLALKYGGQVLLYNSREFLLTFRFHIL